MSQLSEHARQISGFIWQTMNSRGLAVERPSLTQALQDLDRDQLNAVHRAAMQMAKGGDGHDLFHLLGALRIASNESFRAQLRGLAIYWRADKMLELASDIGQWKRFDAHRLRLTQALRDGHQVDAHEAADGLRQMLGSLEVASTPVPPQSTADRTALSPPALGSDAPAQPDPAPTVLTTATPAPAYGGAAAPRVAGARPSEILRQHKLYGQKAACTAELARRGDTHVVMLDMASAAGQGAHRGTSYNWADKQTFMCSPQEMLELLGVLMGWRERLEFRFHGEARDKTLLVERQNGHHYIELRASGVRLGLPVGAADAYALAMLVLAGLAMNEPHLGAQEVLAVARATTAGLPANASGAGDA